MNDIALKEVERLARKILCEHTEFKEFNYGHGNIFLYPERRKHRRYVGFRSLNDESYYKPSQDFFIPMVGFIREWNDVLGLTGQAMRIYGCWAL